MNTTRVGDLTVDELLALLREQMRDVIREVLYEEMKTKQSAQDEMQDLPVIDVGPWPEGLTLRREEMYDDDGR